MDARKEIENQLVALADHRPTCVYDRGAIDVARWLVHGVISPSLRKVLDEIEGRETNEG